MLLFFKLKHPFLFDISPQKKNKKEIQQVCKKEKKNINTPTIQSLFFKDYLLLLFFEDIVYAF